eukprot:Hpha_TRINITY_DN15713_c1_g3::TRINITY_DN15713_c1_g3_i1::g.40963::m.40963
MSKAPYLHPSQRNLASSGPSSHKNEYHVGVLQGNWVEDRASFGAHQEPPKFDAKSLAQASFVRPTQQQLQKRQPIPQGETERALLFGHGNDFHQTNYTTLQELAYTDLSTGDPAVKTNAAFMATGDSRRTVLAAKKKDQWVEDNNPDKNHYATQHSTTHGATAEFIAEHQPPAAQCQRKHPITAAHNTLAARTGLRSPFEYKNTPLHKR